MIVEGTLIFPGPAALQTAPVRVVVAVDDAGCLHAPRDGNRADVAYSAVVDLFAECDAGRLRLVNGKRMVGAATAARKAGK